MKVIIAILLLMSGICFYVALYHFWLYLRRTKNLENFTFAFLAICVGLYDLFCIGLYSSKTVSEGLFWQHFQFAALGMMVPSIIWFVYYLTRQKSKIFYYIISFIFIGFTVGGLTIRNSPITLTIDIINPKSFIVFNRLHLLYNEAEPGIFYSIQTVLSLIIFMYMIILMSRYVKKTKNRYVKYSIYSLILFFFASVNDTCVALGVYRFIYIIEYTFMILVLSMAYGLINQFVNLFYQVEDLNLNLEKKVTERTLELKEARDALWGEMELAKKIQTQLLPPKPTIKGYEIEGYMQTATSVGGDYYDVINVQGADWVVIGDVSGHGVTAGLVMMMVQVALHTIITKYPNLQPAEVLSAVNSVIYDNINRLHADKYMTITVMATHQDNKFFFAGAHLDILIYRAKTQTIECINTPGFWLGIMPDINSFLQDNEFTLEKDDVIFMYTDGIIESRRNDIPDGFILFDMENLIKVLKENGDKSAKEIKEAVIHALDHYITDDDISMLILKKITP